MTVSDANHDEEPAISSTSDGSKWKFRKAKEDPNKMARTIRMRLTLRGFKDRDAEDLTTFAGTSSRLSQRLVVSEAVVQ